MSKTYRRKFTPLTDSFSNMKISAPFKRDDRTEIFENKVADKNIIQRNKLKTQMCKRMVETGNCSFGSSCYFAHHQSEIRKPICFFGDKCKDKKNCGYDHSTEEIPEIPAPKPEEGIHVPHALWKNYQERENEEMIIELEGKDTFKTYSKSRVEELEILKSMMEKVEKDEEMKQLMLDTLKSFLKDTFKEENTVYIPDASKKSVKFIAIECDDDEFESIIDRISQ
jgi:hypothetical protein